MIEITGLTKHYGSKVAVDGLSFQVRPGRVTGFLGPNGAGKSTTMRMILGLDRPTSGSATVNGRSYASLAVPLREVGSLLDARATHGGRSARNHLRCLARSNRIPAARVDHVIEQVGLTEVADQRAKGFSLGMNQRFGIATALLGDPAVVMFDEPVNGLDTDGIRWIRDLMKGLAAEGRTVLLSSHLMSEMELTADHLVVIGRGRLLADMAMRDFIESNSQATTFVRTPDASRFRALLDASGGAAELDAHGRWVVTGLDATSIGERCAQHGVVLHELTPHFGSLEDAYTRITEQSAEYRGERPSTERRPGPDLEARTEAADPSGFGA